LTAAAINLDFSKKKKGNKKEKADNIVSAMRCLLRLLEGTGKTDTQHGF
jgi:hypothetical protein